MSLMALRHRLTTGAWPLRRQILTLAIPVVMEQILNTLTQIVDMMMVGHISAEAVSAVGLSHHPLMLSMAIFMGISTGTTALVARYTGAKDPHTVESVTRQSFWMALLASLFVASVYYSAAPYIMQVMGASSEVAPLGVTYLRWLVPGFVFMQWSQVMSGALRGRGDTITPLRIGVAVNIINVGVSYALIYGHLGLPAMGLAGSALGTSIARGVGASVLMLVLLRSQQPVRLRLSTLFKWDMPTMGRILRIGLPTSGERVLQSFGMISFTRIIAGLGTVSVAAHQLALNAESISYMPAVAFATASTALVGQRLGAKDVDGAGRVVSETNKITAVVMLFMTLAFVFLGSAYMRLYTNDVVVAELSAQMLLIAAAAQIPMGMTFVYSGALRGAGDTLPMMIVTAIGVWGVRLSVTGGLIHLAGWGLAAAWVSMFFDWLFRYVCAYVRFKTGKWATIKL